MPTGTTNFNLQKPTVGADDDAWGDYLNDALDIIDAKLKALELPIGSVFLSAVATNPATLLGYGTWVQAAQGRALVGVGVADGETWALGDTKGSATVTLTTAQLPAHSHASGTLVTDSGGSHTHADTFAVASASLTGQFDMSTTNLSGGDHVRNTSGIVSESVSGSTARKLSNNESSDDMIRLSFDASHSHTLTGSVSSGGAHTHTMSGSTANAGSGSAHSNIQPSIAVYVWQRTA